MLRRIRLWLQQYVSSPTPRYATDGGVEVEPRTSALAIILALSTAVATVFGDWMKQPMEMPVGVLLVLFILIIVPTGDVLRLVAEWINAARPREDDKERQTSR
jgi:hypothetical protein